MPRSPRFTRTEESRSTFGKRFENPILIRRQRIEKSESPGALAGLRTIIRKLLVHHIDDDIEAVLIRAHSLAVGIIRGIDLNDANAEFVVIDSPVGDSG